MGPCLLHSVAGATNNLVGGGDSGWGSNYGVEMTLSHRGLRGKAGESLCDLFKMMTEEWEKG